MKTFILKIAEVNKAKMLERLLVLVIMIMSWHTLAKLLIYYDATVALLDGGIWQLIFLSLICFLGITALTWYLLKISWKRLGLVSITNMVSQFNTLLLWQQLGFYWASFALLVFTAVGCLAAIV